MFQRFSSNSAGGRPRAGVLSCGKNNNMGIPLSGRANKKESLKNEKKRKRENDFLMCKIGAH